MRAPVDGARTSSPLVERFEQRSDPLMLVLSAVFAGLLLAPEVSSWARAHARTLDVFEWMIWAVFAVEFGTRIVLATQRPRYVLTHWYDVVIVALPALRPLRLLRLLRVLRAIRFAALVTRALTIVRRVLVRRGMQYVMLVSAAVVVGAALAVYLVERSGPAPSITDYPTALWWAITTVTTVGYGDTFPTTSAGRGVGIVLMFVGIAVFGVITAHIAALFVEEEQDAASERVLTALERIEARLDALERRMP